MGAGNSAPQGFILGCDEGVVWDLGALTHQVRMQGTHSPAIHLSFPLPLPGLTHLFSFLSHSHCRAVMGRLLRKPCRSHPSRSLQPDTLSAQGEPAQGTWAGDRQHQENLWWPQPHRCHCIPGPWHSEALQRCTFPCVPKWNLWEKSGTCTLKPHSRGNHQGEISSVVWDFYLHLLFKSGHVPLGPVYLCCLCQNVGRVMTHVQARAGCVCKQQLLKHEISSGTYLLWGKFESLGSGAALGQEMPLRGSARPEQGQMCQLWPTGKVLTAEERSSAVLVCDSTWTAALQWCRAWFGILLAGWYQCKCRKNARTCSHSAHKLKYLT